MAVAGLIGAICAALGGKFVIIDGFPLFETAITTGAVALTIAATFVTNRGLYPNERSDRTTPPRPRRKL